VEVDRRVVVGVQVRVRPEIEVAGIGVAEVLGELGG
jgi:hypothetical protein